jgi:hypothetical protein
VITISPIAPEQQKVKRRIQLNRIMTKELKDGSFGLEKAEKHERKVLRRDTSLVNLFRLTKLEEAETQNSI